MADTDDILVLSLCLLLMTLVVPSAHALNAEAILETDHVHLDINLVAKYGHQEPVGSRQLRFSSLWSLEKILLMTRGAINETYSREIGDKVYIKNFAMSLMIDSSQTSLILSYDIYGVVESSFTLGGTSYKVNTRWRYLPIDKRYSVGGEIWVNISQTLFLNFSCFEADLSDWKKTMVGSRTIVFQNVSSYHIPYEIGSRVYKVRVDPSMQIVTPLNAYDVSLSEDVLSFNLSILPTYYIIIAILLLVFVVTVLAQSRLRKWLQQLAESSEPSVSKGLLSSSSHPR